MSPSGRTTILLFVFFHALYALTSSGNAFRIPDEFEVYFQTEHLVDAGDLSIPQTLAIRQPKIVNGAVVGSEPIFYGKFGIDGRPYAPYGPFVAILAVPHHLVARAIARLADIPRAPLPQGIPWVFVVGGLTTLFTATGAALAVAAHLAWNAHRFGNPFDFGYDASETIPQMPPQLFRLADLPRGLVMELASPGKSLILWAPVLLLAAASAREFWRHEPAAALG